ncbi:hypothetical protein D3C80_1474790 [compost metagenome]
MYQRDNARITQRFAQDKILVRRQCVDGDQQTVLSAGGQHHLLPVYVRQKTPQPVGAGIAMRRMPAFRRIVERQPQFRAGDQMLERRADPLFLSLHLRFDHRQIDMIPLGGR